VVGRVLRLVLWYFGDQYTQGQAFQCTVWHGQQVAHAVEQRQRRPNELLVQRVRVLRRERGEVGVAVGIQRTAQSADVVHQRFGAKVDLLQVDPVAPQRPKPGSVLGREVNQQGLVRPEQRLRILGRQRLRVAKFCVTRELLGNPRIESVELVRGIIERGAELLLGLGIALRRRFADRLDDRRVEPLPLTCQILPLADDGRPLAAARNLAVVAATAAPALDTSASCGTAKLSAAASSSPAA
jgi:hypothetical protein